MLSIPLFLIALIGAILYWQVTTVVTAVSGVALLIGAMIMMCIGIIGMYLGKTYMEVKKRPIYLTGETEESYRAAKKSGDDK